MVSLLLLIGNHIRLCGRRRIAVRAEKDNKVVWQTGNRQSAVCNFPLFYAELVRTGGRANPDTIRGEFNFIGTAVFSGDGKAVRGG